MRVDDLLVEVRTKTLTRVGAITPEWLVGTFAPVANDVGSWSLKLPNEHPMVAALQTPGSGIVVTQSISGGERVLMSGPTSKPRRVRDKDHVKGLLTFSGVTDDILLADALAFGDPAHLSTAQTVANDTRTGHAETLMRAYVNANIGSGAIASRRTGLRAFVTLATDLARGATITKSPRFQNLLVLLQEIATLSSLRFRVVQSGASLVFEVRDSTNRVATVRLDIENGTLASEQFEISPPSITRAVVAGQGEGVARVIVQRTTTDSTAAESDWGRTIERFLDARDKSVTTELQQKGDEALLAGGFTSRALKVNASDAQTMRYGEDWVEGDVVGVVIDDVVREIDVTSAAIVVGKDGVLVGAAIGDITAMDSVATVEQRVAATEQRVATLESTAITSSAEIATPSTLMLRDAAGRSQVIDPAVAADIDTLSARNTAISAATPDASATVRGLVKLATNADALTGTDTVRAVTPAGLKGAMNDASSGYRLARVLYFTSGATFSKATYPWLRAMRVKAQGGGGAGGGAGATGGNYSVGSGGGGGGFAESFITDIAGLASSVTVTVGAGGSAVSGGTGGTGGTSSFGALVVAAGGTGGIVKPASAYAPYISGGAGGVATAGDFRQKGGGGGTGAGYSDLGSSGAGGSAQLGGGARGVGQGSGTLSGEAGGTYGGGGGGAYNSATQSAAIGGAGGAGIVVVELYA